jgi:exodeoxyribonuclease VII large subunit
MNERVIKQYSAGEIVDIAQGAISKALPVPIWVKGEVSDFKGPDRKGNIYFELVERRSGRRDAALSVASWSSNWPVIALKLNECGIEVQNGQEMLFYGRVKVFDAKGRVTLEAIDVSPAFSLGQIEHKRLQTLHRLKNEGLFTPNKRRQLPDLPLRLGVISAERSKGINDLIQTLKNSGYPFHVHVCDVLLQGTSMERDVCSALHTFAGIHSSLKLDAICIVRGGSSAADLAWWNNYSIGAAIARMPLPVICGIGHDQDRVAIDEVVHTRCATPTSVGEFLVKKVRETEQTFLTLKDALQERTGNILESRKREISHERDTLAERTERAVLSAKSNLRSIRGSLTMIASSTVRETKRILHDSKRSVISAAQVALRSAKTTLRDTIASVRVDALSKIGRERAIVTIMAKDLRVVAKRLLSRAELRPYEIAAVILERAQDRLRAKRIDLQATKTRIGDALEYVIPGERKKLLGLGALLEARDPSTVLNMGFSITYDDTGKRIKNAASLRPDTIIKTVLANGKLRSRVVESEDERNES